MKSDNTNQHRNFASFRNEDCKQSTYYKKTDKKWGRELINKVLNCNNSNNSNNGDKNNNNGRVSLEICLEMVDESVEFTQAELSKYQNMTEEEKKEAIKKNAKLRKFNKPNKEKEGPK